MKDGIIKGDGTSRLLRAELPATYEAFRAAAAAGTLPVDVLYHAAGWSQSPTFLNKGTLLRDETAALFGLDEAGTPDAVFGKISPLLGDESGYASDFYLYLTGRHPVLNAGPYQDLEETLWSLKRGRFARTVSLSLTGEAETVQFTVYDGGEV